MTMWLVKDKEAQQMEASGNTLPHSGLNTTALTNAATKLLNHLPCESPAAVRFLGVFAANDLPVSDFFALPSWSPHALCCIANTDPSTQPGRHWVAFFVSSRGPHRTIEFFDSYGKSPSFYGFPVSEWRTSFPLSSCANTEMPNEERNTLPLQSLSTTVCGHYCVMFLCLRSFCFLVHPPTAHLTPLQSVSRILHCFAATSALRDKKVHNLFNNLLAQNFTKDSEIVHITNSTSSSSVADPAMRGGVLPKIQTCTAFSFMLDSSE